MKFANIKIGKHYFAYVSIENKRYVQLVKVTHCLKTRELLVTVKMKRYSELEKWDDYEVYKTLIPRDFIREVENYEIR